MRWDRNALTEYAPNCRAIEWRSVWLPAGDRMREFGFTAIQLHGALGYSQDTVLAKWYTQVRSQRLVDGPDEVHRWKVGRNVIKAFREHGTTASAARGDLIEPSEKNNKVSLPGLTHGCPARFLLEKVHGIDSA